MNMAGISVDKLFEQAFEQAGYAGSGLAAGARETLLRYAEDLAREKGFGGMYNTVKTFVGDRYGFDQTSSASNCHPGNPAHTCMRESGAAAMSAIISGAANSMEYYERVRSGEMDAKEAMVKIVSETITSAADSAVKAAGNKAMEILIEKYGSKENALKALAQQGMDALLQNLPVSQGGQQLIDNIRQMLDVATGKTSIDALLKNPGPLIVRATSGPEARIAKIAGNGAVNVVKSKFPKFMTMLPKHPAFLSAGVVVAVAGAIAVKNCIERPYQDLVRNTTTLNEAASELERVSGNILKGQMLFGKFLEADNQMEAQFQSQLSRIDQAGQHALDSILKI